MLVACLCWLAMEIAIRADEQLGLGTNLIKWMGWLRSAFQSWELIAAKFSVALYPTSIMSRPEDANVFLIGCTAQLTLGDQVITTFAVAGEPQTALESAVKMAQNRCSPSHSSTDGVV